MRDRFAHNQFARHGIVPRSVQFPSRRLQPQRLRRRAPLGPLGSPLLGGGMKLGWGMGWLGRTGLLAVPLWRRLLLRLLAQRLLRPVLGLTGPTSCWAASSRPDLLDLRMGTALNTAPVRPRDAGSGVYYGTSSADRRTIDEKQRRGRAKLRRSGAGRDRFSGGANQANGAADRRSGPRPGRTEQGGCQSQHDRQGRVPNGGTADAGRPARLCRGAAQRHRRGRSSRAAARSKTSTIRSATSRSAGSIDGKQGAAARRRTGGDVAA